MRPLAGVGLGLRHDHVKSLLASERPVDFIEIIPENWLRPRDRAALAPCIERWPTSPHSVHLSIGGPDPIDHEFLAAMRAAVAACDAPFFSDHLCYSSIGGIQTRELLPLPFSDEAIEHTVARIHAVKRELDVPLVLENATYYAVMPGSTMDEARFVTTVLAEGDCGFLLDVNNVFVNARNHGYDARAFIDQMPLERVVQLHVAGHHIDQDLDTLVDTHTAVARSEVWELFEYTLRRAGRMIPTIIEWDDPTPPLETLLDEVERARTHAAHALAQGQPAASFGTTA